MNTTKSPYRVYGPSTFGFYRVYGGKKAMYYDERRSEWQDTGWKEGEIASIGPRLKPHQEKAFLSNRSLPKELLLDSPKPSRKTPRPPHPTDTQRLDKLLALSAQCRRDEVNFLFWYTTRRQLDASQRRARTEG